MYLSCRCFARNLSWSMSRPPAKRLRPCENMTNCSSIESVLRLARNINRSAGLSGHIAVRLSDAAVKFHEEQRVVKIGDCVNAPMHTVARNRFRLTDKTPASIINRTKGHSIQRIAPSNGRATNTQYQRIG